jgi:hypothetical protein
MFQIFQRGVSKLGCIVEIRWFDALKKVKIKIKSIFAFGVFPRGQSVAVPSKF